MTYFKRITAAALAALTLISYSPKAFAEQQNETVIIPISEETKVIPDGTDAANVTDSSGSDETSVISTGENTGASIIDPDEKENFSAGSGFDLSNCIYEGTDVSGWTQWDGKTRMVSGKNYYIDGKVSPRSNFTVPAGSRLLIRSGGELVIYKGKTINIRGKITVEPDAVFTISGTSSLYKNSGIENYGTIKSTLSSELRISGDLINRSTGIMTLSGVVNIYKKGVMLNYGEISLTTSSQTKVTGDLQTSDTGRLICRGSISVTINGRVTMGGYFSLSGQVVNSGVFVFERSVRYYKAKSARFAVSKSSRLIDFRYEDDSTPIPGRDDDDEPGKDDQSTAEPDEPTTEPDEPTTPDKPTEPDKPTPPDEDESSEDATDIGIKGIDVSYAQGTIDWAKVKKSGVKFAFLRASRGTTVKGLSGSEDTTFKYNVTEATKAGINVGVYHYLYAETVVDAKKEAKFFLKTIAPYKITYPVVLDLEEQSQANLGKSKITKIAKAFLDEVRSAGYYVMLYSNKSWLTYYLDMSQLSGYEIWLAQWNTVPTYSGDFGIWQYSCKGIVSGISGYVDLDISYKDYAKIIRKGGYNKLK